jgi:hypothetical protein
MQNRNPLEVKAEETNRRHPCKTEPWHFHTAVAYPVEGNFDFQWWQGCY